MDEQIKPLANEKAALEGEVQDKLGEIKNLDTELQSYKESRQQDSATINELESQLHTFDKSDSTRVTTLKEHVQTYKTRWETAEKKLKLEMNSHKEVRNKLIENQASSEELEVQIVDLQTRNRSMQDQLNNVQANDSGHQHQIQGLRRDIEDLKYDFNHDTEAFTKIIGTFFNWKQGDQVTQSMKDMILGYNQATKLPHEIVSFFSETLPTLGCHHRDMDAMHPLMLRLRPPPNPCHNDTRGPPMGPK